MEAFRDSKKELRRKGLLRNLRTAIAAFAAAGAAVAVQPDSAHAWQEEQMESVGYLGEVNCPNMHDFVYIDTAMPIEEMKEATLQNIFLFEKEMQRIENTQYSALFDDATKQEDAAVNYAFGKAPRNEFGNVVRYVENAKTKIKGWRTVLAAESVTKEIVLKVDDELTDIIIQIPQLYKGATATSSGL